MGMNDDFRNDDFDEKDSNIKGTVDGMFVRQYLFDPVRDRFDTGDLLTILQLLNIVLAPNVFDQLPEHTKKHFIEINRKGERRRYGTRRR